LSDALDAAPCGHLVLDARNRVLRCNAALCAMVTRDRGAVVGQRFDGLFSPPSRLFLQTHVFPTLRAEGRVEEIHLTVRRADGADLPVLLNAVCREGGEAEVVLVTTVHRTRFERELVMARHAAERAREDRDRAVAELVRARKQESLLLLARGVAHDFNNLLCAVLGNAEFVGLSLPAQHRARQPLEELVEAAQQAARVSARLLNYAGATRFALTTHRAADLAAHLERAARSDATPGAAVLWVLEDPDVRVNVDLDAMTSMLGALLQNAREASPAGEPITVRLRAVAAREGGATRWPVDVLRHDGPYLELSVIDRGVGMDASTRERLFDPFFSTKAVGRGLGLAMASGIVRAHGGAVCVESAPGLGATARVLLPGDVAPASPSRGSPTS
jgi:signal transduction histidine kinase